ncbi:Uma2 family endonuclease [Aerosakkonemataceae cyanobacterium BLCC-F154]|uniref:Uma2 family endonuclease n=1 Tax=Floridaenema fluviatile BLCC-F154 TaxID=3153640 RepID=A0ABV4YJX0_9CYAN
MSVQLQKRLFTVDEYYRMAEAGILGEDDRVELIAGEIVKMSPIGSPHSGCVNRLNRLFSVRLGDRAILSIQNPVRLNERTEPQPDIALLIPRTDFYSQRHPQPQEVLLIIEVSDTTIEYDREVKIPLYAAAGIVEVWIVSLAEELIEVYRQPLANNYAEIRQFRRGKDVSPLSFSDVVLSVDEVLGG